MATGDVVGIAVGGLMLITLLLAGAAIYIRQRQSSSRLDMSRYSVMRSNGGGSVAPMVASNPYQLSTVMNSRPPSPTTPPPSDASPVALSAGNASYN